MLILLAEYLSMRLLVILLVLMVVRGMAQGPELRVLGGLHHKWYHSYLRLLVGGDDHLYLLRTREGSYWGACEQGERSYDIQRFTRDMRPAGHFQMKSGGNGSPLVNSFEFVRAPGGIAIIGAVRTARRPGTALAVCRPSFAAGKSVEWACDTLVPLPDHIPGFSQNRFRMAWAADSSCAVLSWRQIANAAGPDNPIGCIVLDRDLRPLTGLLTPLSHVQADVGILGLGITDPDHIYFHLRVFDGKGIFQTPQAVGLVLAAYDVASQSLHPVYLGGRRTPLDLRFLPGADGRLHVVGTYLAPLTLDRGAGLFSGTVGASDTLEMPRYHAFDAETTDEIVLDLSKNGVTTLLRPIGLSALLRTDRGWTYTLHLRGQAAHPQLFRAIGPDRTQSLIAWPLDTALQPGAPVRWSFHQQTRTDYLETLSWMPMVVGGRPWALLTDYASAPKIGQPQHALSWLLPLDGRGAAVKAYVPMQQAGHTVLAPRHVLKVGPGRYLALARSHKEVQVLELCWGE